MQMKPQTIKKTLKRIFFLPPVPTLLISLPAYGFVIYTLVSENRNSALTYASYILSAYALVITITGVIRAACLVRQSAGEHPVVRKALGIPFVNRYLQEDTFRAEAALYPGFLINILYAGVKMYSGIHYRSAWFVTLAVYYILLAVMRFSLLYKSAGILSLSGRLPSRAGAGIPQEVPGEEECGGKYRRSSQERKQKKAEKETAGGIGQEQSIRLQEKAADDSKGSERSKATKRSKATDDRKVYEWRRYRLCGVILLFMNVALAGMVILAVHENSGFEYPGMLIYVMAMYAFYAVITAVRNVVKFRKYGSPVLSAAKVICLTAAMVSMLSLETAMLTRFGAAEDAEFRQIMTASAGAGVSCIVLGMAVYMIAHATKELFRNYA